MGVPLKCRVAGTWIVVPISGDKRRLRVSVSNESGCTLLVDRLWHQELICNRPKNIGETDLPVTAERENGS